MDFSSDFAAIIASSDDAIVSKTLDGVVTSWNPSAERMFGYTAEEMIGQSILRLIPSNRREEETEILTQLRAGHRIDHYETVRVAKDGRLLNVSLTISPVKDNSGHIVGASKIIRDITNRKETEQQLEEERRQQHLLYEFTEAINTAETLPELYDKSLDVLQSLLQTNRVAILLLDEQGFVRFRACRGLSDEYCRWIETHSPWENDLFNLSSILLPNIDQSDMDQQLQAATRAEGIRALMGTPIAISSRLIGKLMAYFDQPHVVDEEKISLIQAVVRTLALSIDRKSTELTLRKSEERLLKLSEELEHLVETRTRELSQSQDRLRALTADVNLAEQRERQRLATDLHDNLGQLLALSRMKLDLAKQHPMEPGLEKILATLRELTERSITYTRTLITQLSPPLLREFGLGLALQGLADQMQEQNLNVVVQSAEIPPLPEDQALLLFQSVRELLINCVKHAHVQQATLIMKQVNGSLHISVLDQGVGFDPETARNSTSGGFGIFSIRERMLALGGHFNLNASPGKGTEATLVLPLMNVSDEPSKQSIMSTNQTETKQRMNGSSIRVLVADDHAVVRQGLCSLLAKYDDIEVVGEAVNGHEAVEMATHFQPDILVMDVTMPKLDGIEATRRIRQQHPSAVVIGLSVHGSPLVEKEMREAGAAAFLNKETAVDQLYQTILSVRRTVQSR
jgi:PAS domain S-box-containing protein